MTRKDGETVPCGQDWDVAALADELLKNADIMKQSGGGVTFSGGEPLSQAEFLLELIPLLKEKGVHVAIETSGYAPSETYRSVVSQVDFAYQDVKCLDPSLFKRLTGGDLGVVLANIAWLRESGVPFAFRVPCIPGIGDPAEARAAFAAFADGAKIEFLLYNPAAGTKYTMLGRRYPMDGFEV
jgi:pyruvate formate lyase activating enzyme